MIIEMKSEYDQYVNDQLKRLLKEEDFLLIVTGMPFSGKTTFINEFNKDKKFTEININDINDVNKKGLFITEGDFTTKKSQLKIINKVKRKYMFLFLNVPLKLILKRAEKSTVYTDWQLRLKYKSIHLPFKNSLIINFYEEETSYEAKDVSTELEKNLEVYKSMYKISYKRADNAKQQLLDLYDKKFDEQNLFSINWEEVLPLFIPCLNFNQNHPDHDYLLHKHMYVAAYFSKTLTLPTVKDKRLLFLALLFHDIGKPYTVIDYGWLKEKTDLFEKDEKVELKQGENGLVLAMKKDKVQLLLPNQIKFEHKSHFYNHPELGALLLHRSLSLLFTEEEANYICRLVQNHMIFATPAWRDKTVRNFLKLNKDLMNDLFVMHVCDELATKPNVSSFHFLTNYYKCCAAL